MVENHPSNPLLKLSTQPFEGTLLEKVTCFGEFFQLSVAMVKFLLIELGILSNSKKFSKPLLILGRGKRGEVMASSSYSSRRERGKVVILDVYALK